MKPHPSSAFVCLIIALDLVQIFIISATPVVTGPWERVITDVNVIETPIGVSIDFRYNESIIIGRLTSVPGCPKSIEGFPWVYYGNPPRCFLLGSQGPCPENRLLFGELGSKFGICTCECLLWERNSVRESLDGRFKVCGVGTVGKGQVHDNHEKVCYDLEQRGPCGQGHWLVVDKTGFNLKCVKECPLYFHYDSSAEDCSLMKGGNLGGNPSKYPVINRCPNYDQRVSSILNKCMPNRPGVSLFI